MSASEQEVHGNILSRADKVFIFISLVGEYAQYQGNVKCEWGGGGVILQ